MAARTTLAGLVAGLLVQCLLPKVVFAETVGIFSDNTTGQIQFAAGDIKTALESKGFTVKMFALSSLSSGYANKKVVIALFSNTAVTTVLTGQGGTLPAGLGEQAYALRTTRRKQASYWVLGGDNNGAMYGGLQIAENITSYNGFTGTHNSQESPFLLNRGMKLNLPLDRRIPTYVGGWSSTSAKKSIPSVWDMTFWKTLIDEQARRRYNMLSVWVHHPFPALVKLADYPNVSLPRIEGFDGYVKEMTHDQRVAFWREVMTHAHSRGLTFYFFNWNVYVDYASSQYPGITRDQSSTTTKDYMYKSMQALIATYPELDGFGISAGDGMSGDATDRTNWTWDSYGKAARDYLAANPSRKFTIIHRALSINLDTLKTAYASLMSLPNATLSYSVKYAQAHMYSASAPKWSGGIDDVSAAGMKTWLTVRNDDYFFLNWGDPKFVRDFMAGIPHKDAVTGMYIGSDGYNPARTYFYKDSAMNGQLEVQRRGYMEMLWGRLGYNPQTSDNVFKNYIAMRYPTVASPGNLFRAWALASRQLPRVTELIMGSWSLDFHWWPEACWSDPGRGTGFRTIGDFAGTTVAKGSSLCNIATSASGNCGTAKSSYTLANEIQADADSALDLINTVSSRGNADLEVAIKNVRQLGYLSNYYAYKIRGATLKKASQNEKALAAVSQAYCFWTAYARSMDSMYFGDAVRNVKIPDWNFGDAAVLKEFTDLGGTGTPNCVSLRNKITGRQGSADRAAGH